MTDNINGNEIASRRPHDRGKWSARWVRLPNYEDTPMVVAYRCCFDLKASTVVRLRVTADERYALFLDGNRIGRGPERGDLYNWFYETYELTLDSGAHTLVACVWSFGMVLAPPAQLSLRHGFLLMAEHPDGDILSTGLAPWQAKRLSGFEFTHNHTTWGAGPDTTIDGKQFDWEFHLGLGEGWLPVELGEPGANANDFADSCIKAHQLRPAILPPMLNNEHHLGTVRHIECLGDNNAYESPIISKSNLVEKVAIWNNLLTREESILVDPNSKIRIIIDLQDYYCAYPKLIVSNGAGASVRIHWAESLYEELHSDPSRSYKGQRDDIEGKYFIGVGDIFKPDGGEKHLFETLWWRAGRYVELLVQTTDKPLIIESFILEETRYPLAMESQFSCNEPKIDTLWPIMIRSVQMCSHETFVDCPYYEQLMYVGDSRISALNTYCMTSDDLLPRKAIEFFDLSHLPSGLTRSQYPSHNLQIIAPFSLWWIAMVYDYAMWRNDRKFIMARMPGVRSVIELFLNRRDNNGLIISPIGWNFVDWVPEWESGVPPDGATGVSAVINWHFTLALTMVAKLEDWLGESELACRANRLAMETSASLTEHLWDEKRKLFADDLAKQHFSEHTQCLAMLSDLLDSPTRTSIAENLFEQTSLSQTTIYFSHYYFETCCLLGRIDKLFERLELWFDLEQRGFKTTFESPGNTRSDCHAWGAHPIYHCFATILGIHPGEFGFRTVNIKPQLGPLNAVEGSLIHPLGKIEAKLNRDGNYLTGWICLPDGLTGKLIFMGGETSLKSGYQEIKMISA